MQESNNKIVNDKLTEFRNKTSNPQYTEFGKLPPQAVALEESVLGALMLEKDAINKAIDIIVSPEIFYKEEHKIIWNTILLLKNEGHPIDILTITNKLRFLGKLEFVGGSYYISELTNRVGMSSNIEYHAALLFEKYLLREMIRIGSDMQEEAFEDTTDCFDLLTNTENEIKEINKHLIRLSGVKSLSDQVESTLQRLQIRIKGEGFIKTRWNNLNKIIGGWQKKEVHVIAARPSMGKTAAVLNDIEFQISKGRKCQMFSIEMSAEKLLERLASVKTSISSDLIQRGLLSDEHLNQIGQYFVSILGMSLIIDDTSKLSITQLRAKIDKERPEIVYIDYLQLMDISTVKNGTRDQAIGVVTRELKSIAKEYDIPIILLCQLNRECEKSGDKRPMMSHLRESGNIEQDMDIIITLWRPAQYKMEAPGMSLEESQHYTEMDVVKDRNGRIGTVVLNWFGDQQLFTDATDEMPTPESYSEPQKIEDETVF